MIDQDGKQLGIMTKTEALSLAEKVGLDLVEISPNATPPVVKIIDWGKYQYQKIKEQQKIRKKSKSVDLKQIRIGLKIGSNDLSIKLKRIAKFLEEGNKVKIQIVFKGREMAHQEIGYHMMDRIISLLQDIEIIEQKPLMAGRNLSITVRSK